LEKNLKQAQVKGDMVDRLEEVVQDLKQK